jgi:hypothetical protein
MNNFVEIDGKIAFFYNGWTFERNATGTWFSIKTCIDPAINFTIQKRGSVQDEYDLKVLAIGIKNKINEIEI